MHSHNLTASKDPKRSLVKETRGDKETKKDSSNNVDQDSAKDPLKHNIIPPTHLDG